MQRTKVEGYCNLYELELARVVTDPGISAKSLDRPGWHEVEELLRSGQAEGLVIAKLDRLTRSLEDWAYLINTYFGDRARHPRQLFSVGDAIDTRTATGRMVLNIIMTIAQWEREIIAERTREAMAQKIRKGERAGKVRYGHRPDHAGPMHRESGNPLRVIDDATELEAIRLMRSLSDEGRSLRAIAEALRILGIGTKEGKTIWMPATINRILKRERAADGQANAG
jgi:site-specific DNA recombinase